MDFVHVGGIVGIDERPHADEHVACADILARVGALGRGEIAGGEYMSSLITCSDMKRFPASGSVNLTGPASRSKTAAE